MPATLATRTTAPDLAPQIADMRDPLFLTDPRRLYQRLREQGRVHRDSVGLWLLLGHADCRAAMQSSHLSRDPRNWKHYATVRPYMAESALEKTVERFMIFNDAPFHTRLRTLMSAAFTPAATRALTVAIDAASNALLDRLPASEPFDFMRQFAQILPVRVISDMLGIETGDLDQTKAWSEAISMVVEPVAARGLREHSNRATIEMTGYLRAELARRRAHPSDALLDVLIEGQRDDPSLSDDDLLANLMLLFLAGHETTTNLLGNGLLALLRHPEQMQMLRLDPSLLPLAIEEMLRFESPANVVARVTREPWRIGELEIPAGELLYCMTGAANHDPEVFARPEVFDIRRSPNPHLSFGGGVHYCIGAPLARLEAQVAFGALLRRFESLSLADEAVCWRPLVNLRGLQALTVKGGG